MNIWLISDTHFGHENIIKFCNRPYTTVREMDEDLIEKWNSVVKQGDLVYHLGDVYLKASKGYIESILRRLNGNKRLILGNHDNGKDQILQRFFQSIDVSIALRDFKLHLTHYPIHSESIKPGYKNIHGHIHEKHVMLNKFIRDGNYRNISVEQIGYTPINIKEVKIG